ncbi:MAG: family 43 glycosylhydrolase, partial [Mangrovibacterium sp.]
RWWNQGHGSLVEDTQGQWWMLYHGYEKYFQTLGRQMLMLPVEWTNDGWFRIPESANAAGPLPLPAGKSKLANNCLCDDFNTDELGLQWQFFKRYQPERAQVEKGKLSLKAEGTDFGNSSPLLVNAGDRHYEVQVEYTLGEGATAGLCLYYNETANMHLAVNDKSFTVYNRDKRKISVPNTLGNHGYLRVVNDENEVSFWFSADAKNWERVERSIEASGFNHNVFGEFLSLRAGLIAFGSDEVCYDNYVYLTQEN